MDRVLIIFIFLSGYSHSSGLIIDKRFIFDSIFGTKAPTTHRHTTLNTHYSSLDSKCQNSLVDVVFLMDSSGSEGPDNFQKQKDFVAGFAKAFKIGPKNMQISVLTFSTHVYSEFKLNAHDNTADLVQAIEKIGYRSGTTQTHLGLQSVDDYAFQHNHGDRFFAPNVLIVLTDGKSANPYDTFLAARNLLREGVEIFAVGIGDRVSTTELKNIAGNTNNIFSITSFDLLYQFQNILENALCKAINGTDCKDHINCGQYSSAICTVQVQFAEKNCPLSCGFCDAQTAQHTCSDAVSNCRNYIGDICHNSKYRAWMLRNCPRYCGACDALYSTTTTSTTTTPTTTITTTTPTSTTTTPTSTTTTPTTTMTTAPSTTTPLDTPEPFTGPVVCEDKDVNCAAYGEQVCSEKRHWAVLNCARFCLFCHDNATHHPPLTTRHYSVCVDKFEFCSDHGKGICTNYQSYAADNCPAYCGFCTPVSTTTTTTSTTTESPSPPKTPTTTTSSTNPIPTTPQPTTTTEPMTTTTEPITTTTEPIVTSEPTTIIEPTVVTTESTTTTEPTTITTVPTTVEPTTTTTEKTTTTSLPPLSTKGNVGIIIG